MTILLLGATGFIGSEIARALSAQGKMIIGLARDPDEGARLVPGLAWIKGDLRHLVSPASWVDMLEGVDIIINASGALQSGLRDNVDQVQSDAIIALIDAATAKGVRRFIQISASNATTDASTDFMASKARADAVLSSSGLDHAILRPGLVIGRNAFGGTELIRLLAGVPLVAPGLTGLKPVQCVGMEDVVSAVMAALDAPAPLAETCDLVGETAHGLTDIIAAHRTWLGLPKPRWSLTVPGALLRPVALVADMLGWLGWRSPLRSTAIAALTDGVSGRAEDAQCLLGRPCQDLSTVLSHLPPAGKADRWHARLGFLFPLGLAALITLWMASGLLGLFQTDAAARLLVEGGMGPGRAQACVIAGSLADLGIALGLIWRASVKPALSISLGVMAVYLAGSAWVRPDLWLDPLGPMLKVLPAFVLTLVCLAMADER